MINVLVWYIFPWLQNWTSKDAMFRDQWKPLVDDGIKPLVNGNEERPGSTFKFQSLEIWGFEFSSVIFKVVSFLWMISRDSPFTSLKKCERLVTPLSAGDSMLFQTSTCQKSIVCFRTETHHTASCEVECELFSDHLESKQFHLSLPLWFVRWSSSQCGHRSQSRATWLNVVGFGGSWQTKALLLVRFYFHVATQIMKSTGLSKILEGWPSFCCLIFTPPNGNLMHLSPLFRYCQLAILASTVVDLIEFRWTR